MIQKNIKKITIKFNSKEASFHVRDDADESVIAEIFKWREYKAAEDIIRKANKPILDIGAHLGAFSVYAKMINPDCKIYAFEPEKDNFNLLKKNLKINNFEDISIFNIALSGETSIRKFILEEENINHHIAYEAEMGEFIMVKTLSFSDFLKTNNILKVSLLKADIEGGEYEIFENMSSKDFLKVENIIFEYHNYNGRNFREIEDILRKNGFSVQIFPSRFEKDLGFIFAQNKRNKQ